MSIVRSGDNEGKTTRVWGLIPYKLEAVCVVGSTDSRQISRD